MIVSAMFLILLLNSYMSIHFSRILSKKSNDILQNANAVRSKLHPSDSCVHARENWVMNISFYFSLQFALEFIHNMRTIKQLSVEKHILGEYVESIDQARR